MATRIAGFVIVQSTGQMSGGVTVTPRASDGSVGATGVTDGNGFVAIGGLADKVWTGTVAAAGSVFVPVTTAEEWLSDDLHGQRGTLAAHDFSHLRGKLVSAQINSGAAAAFAVLKADGAGNAAFTSLSATDLPTHEHEAGDITTGILALARGGTGADLSATGGTGQYVKQSGAGAGFTVGTIPAGDVPDLSATYAIVGRNLVAGAGLTGGGTLAADRQFDVNVDNATIEINADALRIKDLGVVTAKYAAASVTLAKIQNAAANSKLLGSGASGAGASYTEITLGTNLSMSGTTLNASGGGTADAYSHVTDGTTTADASGADTFKLRSANDRLTVAVQSNDGTHGDNALFTLVEANINHDALASFVANEHVDHSAVTLTAGAGLTGGGDLTTSRQFDVNVDNATIEINTDALRIKDLGVVTAKLDTNAVTYPKFQQASAGFTIIAKVDTGAGNYAELAAGSDGVLRRSGSGNLAFGTLVAGNVGDGVLTLAKFAGLAANNIIGPGSPPAALAADPSEVLRRKGSGSLDFGTDLGTLTSIDVDNLNLDGNTLKTITSGGDLNLLADGSSLVVIGVAGDTLLGDGTLRLVRPHTDLKIDLGSGSFRYNDGRFGGTVYVGNLSLTGNTIATTNSNGDLILAPNGSGRVRLNDSDDLAFGNDADVIMRFNQSVSEFEVDVAVGLLSEWRTDYFRIGNGETGDGVTVGVVELNWDTSVHIGTANNAKMTLSASGAYVGVRTPTADAELAGVFYRSNTTTNSTATTSEEVLKTTSLSGGHLDRDGKHVHVIAWGTFANNSRAKQVRLYFGTTVIADSTSLAYQNNRWVLEGWIYRTGAATQDAIGRFNCGISGTGPSGTSNVTVSTPGATLSGAVVVEVKSQVASGASASDVVQEGMMIEHWGG